MLYYFSLIANYCDLSINKTLTVKNHLKISQLIARHFAEILSEKENVELNEWIKSDKNNQILFKKILDKKNFNKSFDQFSQYKVKEELKTLKQKIHNNNKSKTFNISQLLKYAAVIMIPLAIATYLYITRIPESIPTTIGIKSEPIIIHPGSSKAQLIVNNTQIYELKNNTELKIEDKLVKIENKGGALVYTKAKSAPLILQKEELHTLTIPRGAEYYLVLSDGTKIWLNSETELKYPKQFIGKKRQIELIKGEVYCEVSYDKNCPFTVKTQKSIINVLGTSFNIRAYEDEINNITTLVEGSVNLRHRFDEESIVVLKPGDQASIISVNHKIKLKKVKTAYYTAWKDNRFEFYEEPLKNIIRDIARWYNVEFNFEDNIAKNYLFSARLDKYENIEKLVEKIELTKKVNIKITKKGLSISKYND
jgi:hypothetical protein